MVGEDLNRKVSKRASIVISIAACLAVFLVCVEFAGIAIALPEIASALSLSLPSIQWCVTGYLVSFGGAILLGGTIGDAIGPRRVLAGATVAFLLGSAACGAAHESALLVGGRVLQGIAAAFIWPNATSSVYRLAPTGGKAGAVSLMTGVVGIAMAAGPFLAGYLCEIAGWRWFFYTNVPLCAVIIICLLSASIPNSRLPSNRDALAEATLFSFSLVLLLLVVSVPGGPVLGRGAALICACVIFCWWGFRRRAIASDWPIRELLAIKPFAIGCALRLLVNLAFYSFLYVSGLYLTNSEGLSTFSAGLFFLPTTIALTVCSFFSSRLMQCIGEPGVAIVGFGASLFGYINLAAAAHHSTQQLLFSFTSLGVGYGVLSPYLFASTMSVAAERHSGKASALFYMASLFGSLIGTAISTQIVERVSGDASRDLWGDAFPFVMSACAVAVVCAALIDVLRRNTKRSANIAASR